MRTDTERPVSDLPMGSYYVQEISTNCRLSERRNQISRLSLSTPVRKPHGVSITANEGEAIENDLIYGAQSAARSPMRTGTL